MTAPTKSFFEQLYERIKIYQEMAKETEEIGFLGQEVIRFYSIAGTLLNMNGYTLDENANINERYVTHILMRSLLENFFWILYIFEEQTHTSSRYAKFLDSYKKEYAKLLNDPYLPYKDQLNIADPSWKDLPKSLDLNSVLAQIKNDYGDRMSYIYFIYRIASFDTHGKSLGVLFQDSFGARSNFPVINIVRAIELISTEYLDILNKLQESGETKVMNIVDASEKDNDSDEIKLVPLNLFGKLWQKIIRFFTHK